MSWDFDLKTNSNKQNFTTFPQGITKIRVVDDEPFIRWTHWINEQKRTVTCPGTNICPICAISKQEKANKMPPKYSTSRRFAINIINRETGKLEILEQGVTFFENLKDLYEELQDGDKGLTLADVDLKVRRKGEAMQTSYRIDFDETFPMTEADKKLIADKVDLATYFKPHTPEVLLRVLNGESLDDIVRAANETTDEIEDDMPVLK